MKTIQANLLRSARSFRTPRPLQLRKEFPPAWGPFGSTRNFLSIAEREERRRRRQEALEMAPKGQKFELKTAKGTKDCKSAACAFGVS
jgi:hypothetical protein